MTPPSSVLRYDSPAYLAHAEVIDGLEDRAERLNLLRGTFRHEIFGDDGVMCQRERGDARGSVGKSFFSLALSAERAGSRLEMRELLSDVLAARYSLGERPTDDASWSAVDQPAYPAYQELVRQFETHCQRHGIPSLFPNLFDAASLFTRLKDRAYDLDRPGVREMYAQLIEMLVFQEKHLHAVTTSLQRRGGDAEVVSGIDTAASVRELPVAELFRRNPLQVETYAQALFAGGRRAEVKALVAELGDDLVITVPVLVQIYLRSLIDDADNAAALAFIQANGSRLPAADHVSKAVGIACEQLGWWLYGEGRYEEAKAFLETHAARDIAERGGRDNMRTLYTTVCEAID
ncbi:MAG: hypothetical protein KBC95_02095 [Candidatus Peribacteraceae bacterium]|nr:hypothetical protein [Candidatus Peribacteraceae bacterium]